MIVKTEQQENIVPQVPKPTCLVLRFPTSCVTSKLVLKAIAHAEDKKGATVLFITKYIDSKLKTFSNRSEIKLHLRNAVKNGRIEKNYGKYTIKPKLAPKTII
ncbi:h15 domain-containing protein [Trichonephila clavipes]|nr:h15 domain-containing protein [Trichonephila clavipes]